MGLGIVLSIARCVYLCCYKDLEVAPRMSVVLLVLRW